MSPSAGLDQARGIRCGGIARQPFVIHRPHRMPQLPLTRSLAQARRPLLVGMADDGGHLPRVICAVLLWLPSSPNRVPGSLAAERCRMMFRAEGRERVLLPEELVIVTHGMDPTAPRLCSRLCLFAWRSPLNRHVRLATPVLHARGHRSGDPLAALLVASAALVPAGWCPCRRATSGGRSPSPPPSPKRVSRPRHHRLVGLPS